MKRFLYLIAPLSLLFACSSGPTVVYVTSISISSYPVTDPSGASWDTAGGPDLYLEFGGSGTSNNTTEIQEDATSQNISWIFDEPIFLTAEPSSALTIMLRDDDPGENPSSAMIGSTTWYTGPDKTDAPASISISEDGITMTLFLNWS